MKTEPGKTYDVTVESTPLVAGAEWVLAPLAKQYQVKILGQQPVSATSDVLRSRVRVTWTGKEPGTIQIGDPFADEGMLTSYGLPAASAMVADVQEAASAAPEAEQKTYVNVLEISAAVVLLGYVAWSAHKIKTKLARKKARR